MSKQGSQAYRLIDYFTQSVLYGMGSLTCISLSGILSFLIYKQKRAILELEKMDALLPQEVFDLISSRYRQKIAQLQQQKQEGLVRIPGKFLVKGEVSSHQMIPTIDNIKDTGLVYQRMQIDKIYMRSNQINQNVVEKRNELQDDKCLKMFEIVNPYSSQVYYGKKGNSNKNNNNNNQIDHNTILVGKENKNQWNLKKNNNNSNNNINNNINNLTEFESGQIKCLVTNFGNKKKTNIERALRPIAYIEKFNETIKANLKIQAGTILIIGFTQNQIGIKIGDQVMVYGSVIFDLNKRILQFDIPDVIAKRKFDVQEFVSHQFSLKSIASFFLFSLGAFYAYKAIAAYLKHRKFIQKYLAKRIRATDLDDQSW